ncbi:hypothetical protein [Hydrocoleum sp. CS-953]|nr:hypothetical protein [Hydrocoleum sp. CS-953]
MKIFATRVNISQRNPVSVGYGTPEKRYQDTHVLNGFRNFEFFKS